jgi:hypothetical protein
MALLTPYELRRKIEAEEFDYTLLRSALAGYSGIKTKINDLVRKKIIVRVKKGLYVFGPDFNESPICKETLANLIYGPSCISLEYALAYHGLIPERVETLTSVTPKRDKYFKTPLGQFTYRYLKPEKYPLGIEQVWIDERHPILIASPEKALLDYLSLNKIEPFESESDVERFLYDDLRIDPSHLERVKPRRMRKLNHSYRNGNAEKISNLLERKEGDS